MSKIFDALRKVQAEVSGKSQLAESRGERAPSAPSGGRESGESPNGSLDLNVPESFVAELVAMRYSLESRVGRAHKAIAFTCAVRGEGVSTVARIFSRILVQDPQSRVVLVDANAHAPSVHERFGVNKGPGLSDYLAGRSTLQECVHKTSHPRMWVIPAGEAMISPMQAFASDAFRKMITEVTAGHDYLVIDAPPVLMYPETTILSSKIDGVVFVVEAVRTKKEVIRKAVDAIGKGGGEVLGLVLNKNKHFIPEFIYKRV